MSLYNLALFVHVTADLGLFIGLGTQLFCLAALRRAQSVEQVRALAGLITLSDPLAIGGALLTIGAGAYLAGTAWGWRAGWIVATLVSLVVVVPALIRGVIEPRLRRIVTLAHTLPAGPLPPALYGHIHDPLLGTALQTLGALLLGIVFLMTTKPALAGAALALAVAVGLGVLSGLPLWWAARRR